MDEDFRALFDGHATRVVRFASLLGADDPEDIAQEAFRRLYQHRGRVQGRVADAAGYLHRIVVNRVRDHHRRAVSHRRFRLLTRRDDERHVPSPEDVTLCGEDAWRVRHALDRLPPRRREAVVLRYWLELSYAEIAKAMGVNLGTAKSAVSRGLGDLHAYLEES